MANMLKQIPQNQNIKNDRSIEFKRTAENLSDFILTLPLTNEQNDKLIDLIKNHVFTVEREAMEQGINIARDIDEMR